VEISAPPHSAAQWPAATLVASVVAALVLVLLLIIAVAMLSSVGSADAKRSAQTRRAPSHPEPKRATLTRAQTSVLVLNGNGITGAAAAEASRVRARGYKVSGTGNAAQTHGRSVILYRPGHRPEALRLARDEGISLVGPLDGITPRQLHGAHVVIVLGT
jgi:LytR cell envelope-related transcriptional attenuator